jgi:hypothetical protein
MRIVQVSEPERPHLRIADVEKVVGFLARPWDARPFDAAPLVSAFSATRWERHWSHRCEARPGVRQAHRSLPCPSRPRSGQVHPRPENRASAVVNPPRSAERRAACATILPTCQPPRRRLHARSAARASASRCRKTRASTSTHAQVAGHCCARWRATVACSARTQISSARRSGVSASPDCASTAVRRHQQSRSHPHS